MTPCENAKIRESVAHRRGGGCRRSIHLQESTRTDTPVYPSDRTVSPLKMAGTSVCDAAGRSTGREERLPHPGHGACSRMNPLRAER